MKIKVVKNRYDDNNEFEEVIPEFFESCCNESYKAWQDGAIGFGGMDLVNKIEDVCIYAIHAYPEGAVWDSYPIKYCPFCGKEVEVIIKEKESNSKRNGLNSEISILMSMFVNGSQYNKEPMEFKCTGHRLPKWNDNPPAKRKKHRKYNKKRR